MAMKRGTIEEFQNWCDDIADLLISSVDCSILPGLSFLASTSPINILEEEPIAILLDDALYKADFLLISIQGGLTYTNSVPDIGIRSFDPATGNLTCTVTLESFSCQMIMNFNNPLLWTVISSKEITVRLIKDENNVITANLEKIMNTFSPTLIMPKGYIIEGRTKITPSSSIQDLPDELWIKQDWSHCDITAEVYKQKPKPKKLPVINKVVIKLIEKDFDKPSDVLVLDDGAHEISDVIWIQGSKHIIHYVHCKPSKINQDVEKAIVI
jgi:hypothetical protein